MRFLLLACAAVGALGLAGCGGSSSASAPLAPESVYSGIVTRGVSNGTPITATTYSGTFTGVAGSFSSISYRDTSPSDRELLLAYSTGDTSIGVIGLDGTGERWLGKDRNGSPVDLEFNLAMNRVYYSANASLRWFPISGGGWSEVNLGSLRPVAFDFSPDGQQVVFIAVPSGETDGEIYTCNVDGTSLVRRTTDATDVRTVCWPLPDLVFSASSTSLFSGPVANPLVQTVITGGSSIRRLNASPNGDWVSFTDLVGGVRKTLYGGVRMWGDLSTLRTVETGNAVEANFTADSRGLIYADTTTDRTRIRQVSIVDGTSNTISLLGNNTGVDSVACATYVTNRVLVGPGGIYSPTAASGILVSQTNDGTNNTLLFSVATPATARLGSDQSAFASGAAVFWLEGDALSRIAWTTEASWRLTSITPAAGQNGAIVTYNSDTGLVASVTTYNVTRSGKPKVRVDGGRVVIEGQLGTVYDGSGQARPAGSRVEIAVR